jgi:hypothetical protein
MVTSSSTSTAPPTNLTPNTTQLLGQKIDMTTAGLPLSYGRNLRPLCVQNVYIIAQYPSLREKCYHAMSRDLSCRPAKILKLKIRDVSLKLKTIGYYQYGEVVVNGKTGTRPISLINSPPYLKYYLDHEHPMPSNPGTLWNLKFHFVPFTFQGSHAIFR